MQWKPAGSWRGAPCTSPRARKPLVNPPRPLPPGPRARPAPAALCGDHRHTRAAGHGLPRAPQAGRGGKGLAGRVQAGCGAAPAAAGGVACGELRRRAPAPRRLRARLAHLARLTHHPPARAPRTAPQHLRGDRAAGRVVRRGAAGAGDPGGLPLPPRRRPGLGCGPAGAGAGGGGWAAASMVPQTAGTLHRARQDACLRGRHTRPPAPLRARPRRHVGGAVRGEPV